MDLRKQFEQQYIREDITRYRLSKKTGISAENLRKIEDGRCNPHLSTLQKIADALNCSMADLFAESTDDIPFTKQELIMIEQFKALPAHQQALIMQLINELQTTNSQPL